MPHLVRRIDPQLRAEFNQGSPAKTAVLFIIFTFAVFGFLAFISVIVWGLRDIFRTRKTRSKQGTAINSSCSLNVGLRANLGDTLSNWVPQKYVSQRVMDVIILWCISSSNRGASNLNMARTTHSPDIESPHTQHEAPAEELPLPRTADKSNIQANANGVQ